MREKREREGREQQWRSLLLRAADGELRRLGSIDARFPSLLWRLLFLALSDTAPRADFWTLRARSSGNWSQCASREGSKGERERELRVASSLSSPRVERRPPPFEKKNSARPRPLHSLTPKHQKQKPRRLSDDGTPLTHAELLSLLEQQGVAPGGRKREAQPFQAKVRRKRMSFFEFEVREKGRERKTSHLEED